MSTSGTVGQTVFTVDRVISHAMSLAGLPASRLTPENVLLINESLYLMLIELTALGVNLWTVEQVLLGMYPGQIRVRLPTGTTDILNQAYRITQRVQAVVGSDAGGSVAFLQDSDVDTICTQVSPDGSFTFDLNSSPTDGPIPITTFGLLPGASGIWSYVLEQSADNLTFTPILIVTLRQVTDGEWIWVQLEPACMQRYLRLRATGGTTFSLREAYLCGQYNDITIARLNRDDYSGLPYKQFPSQQPLQAWVDRRFDGVDLVLWPSPSTTFACLWAFIYQETQDVGALTDSLAVPYRALPGIVKKLALDILLKIPGADLKRKPDIKEMSDASIIVGRGDERDNSPIMLGPDISVYTR